MTETQIAIQELIEEIRQIEAVNRRVKETKLELNASNKLLKQLGKRLDKELADVEKMESMSVKAVFYKVLGSKEEQLEKERQEYLQMSLKFNDQKDKIELLEFELDVLNKKLRNKGQMGQKLKALKRKRQKEIIHTNPLQAQELLNISNHVDNNIVHSRKLNEAITAGAKCVNTLKEIISELKNAQHWGRWDTYGGGGRRRRAGYMKHGAIDRARSLANIVNHEIVKFNRELKDAGEQYSRFDISIDNFNGFMDIFFDNLITDWIMQQKIVNSMNNIKATKDQIAMIVSSIQMKMKKLSEENIKLQADYDKILIS